MQLKSRRVNLLFYFKQKNSDLYIVLKLRSIAISFMMMKLMSETILHHCGSDWDLLCFHDGYDGYDCYDCYDSYDYSLSYHCIDYADDGDDLGFGND
jgi:hypothetical protein